MLYPLPKMKHIFCFNLLFSKQEHKFFFLCCLCFSHVLEEWACDQNKGPQGQQSTVRIRAGCTAARHRMILASYVREEGTWKASKNPQRSLS